MSSHQYYMENRDKILEKIRKYNDEHPNRSKEISRKYRLAHKEEIRKRNKKYFAKYYAEHKSEICADRRIHYAAQPMKARTKSSHAYSKRRQAFLDMYGRKCICCGETIEEFLTIEHKNGQRGQKREASIQAYSMAIKEYRPDLFEVLCMNCNHCIGRYGYCPHKK